MKKLALALAFVAGTSVACPNPSLIEAAVLDTTTTAIGLTWHPNASELSPLGAVGATIFRLFVIVNEDRLSDKLKTNISAIWMGAGIHNIVHMLGVGFAPSMIIGIAAGLAVKENNDCTKDKGN